MTDRPQWRRWSWRNGILGLGIAWVLWWAVRQWPWLNTPITVAIAAVLVWTVYVIVRHGRRVK